ncbi:MAG: hypothetical protein WCQ26_08270 [Pseudanabaena sp. ELA748]
MFDLAQHLVTNLDLTFHLSAINFSSDFHINIFDIHTQVNMDLLAQQFKQDMMGDAARSWDNFVKTGQIWALLVGVMVGYLFKTLTSY